MYFHESLLLPFFRISQNSEISGTIPLISTTLVMVNICPLTGTNVQFTSALFSFLPNLKYLKLTFELDLFSISDTGHSMVWQILCITRKHSSRMRTAHMLTVCVSIATRCEHKRRVHAQWGPMSGGKGVRLWMVTVQWGAMFGWGEPRGSLYSEVQWIIGNGLMGNPLWADRLANT